MPMDFHSALGALRTIVKQRPDAILVNEGANTLDFARSIIDVFKPRKRLDVGTWGIMGIGMGAAVAAAVETGQRVLAVEGDSAFGFRAWKSRQSAAINCRSVLLCSTITASIAVPIKTQQVVEMSPLRYLSKLPATTLSWLPLGVLESMRRHLMS